MEIEYLVPKVDGLYFGKEKLEHESVTIWPIVWNPYFSHLYEKEVTVSRAKQLREEEERFIGLIRSKLKCQKLWLIYIKEIEKYGYLLEHTNIFIRQNRESLKAAQWFKTTIEICATPKYQWARLDHRSTTVEKDSQHIFPENIWTTWEERIAKINI